MEKLYVLLVTDPIMRKWKAGLVAGGSQQGRHLYGLISSATVSSQVLFLLFNAASYHQCMLSTVDIRGVFLNAKFTLTDTHIYIKRN